MSAEWQFQVRIDVPEPIGTTLRSPTEHVTVPMLGEILDRHRARAVCQYDAFAGYCAEAEREGTDAYPLYRWTKATIEDPTKKAKYLQSFTLYVDDQQVYSGQQADALEADLQPLLGSVVTRIMKYDTNPANNPQPPASQHHQGRT